MTTVWEENLNGDNKNFHKRTFVTENMKMKVTLILLLELN